MKKESQFPVQIQSFCDFFVYLCAPIVILSTSWFMFDVPVQIIKLGNFSLRMFILHGLASWAGTSHKCRRSTTLPVSSDMAATTPPLADHPLLLHEQSKLVPTSTSFLSSSSFGHAGILPQSRINCLTSSAASFI